MNKTSRKQKMAGKKKSAKNISAPEKLLAAKQGQFKSVFMQT